MGPHFHTSHTHPTMASVNNNNAMLAMAAASGPETMMATMTAKTMVMAIAMATAMPKVNVTESAMAISEVASCPLLH